MLHGLRLGSAALFVALVAACNFSLVAPSFVVRLPDNDFGEFELWVYEEPGIVTGGQANPEGQQGSMEFSVTAHPERNELDLAWTGGACAHRAQLSVTGSQQALRLELRPAPIEWSLSPQECPAVGLLFSVTLTLSAPVEQAAVTAVEVR